MIFQLYRAMIEVVFLCTAVQQLSFKEHVLAYPNLSTKLILKEGMFLSKLVKEQEKNWTQVKLKEAHSYSKETIHET